MPGTQRRIVDDVHTGISCRWWRTASLTERMTLIVSTSRGSNSGSRDFFVKVVSTVTRENARGVAMKCSDLQVARTLRRSECDCVLVRNIAE